MEPKSEIPVETITMPVPEKKLSLVHCVKIKKKDSIPEFTLKIRWSDNTSYERLRTHNNITDFMRILSIITPDSVNNFPLLKDPQNFLGNGIIKFRGDKKKSELDQFFQKLITAVPSHILIDERFLGFFEVSSASELKTKYTKILENSQVKDTQRRSTTVAQESPAKDNSNNNNNNNEEEGEEKEEEEEVNYSLLNLPPNKVQSVDSPSQTYQMPEQLESLLYSEVEAPAAAVGQLFSSRNELIYDEPLCASAARRGREAGSAKADRSKSGSGGSGGGGGGNYWVVRDYNSRHADEMDVERGVVVSVLEKHPNGKWLVRNKDTKEIGLIPKNILFPQRDAFHLENDDDRAQFVATKAHIASTADELSVAQGEALRVVSSPAAGWWLVRVGDKVGKVPGSCIGVLKSRKSVESKEEQDGINDHQDLENLEELYSKVEKLKFEKKPTTSQASIERLPGYVNLFTAGHNSDADEAAVLRSLPIEEVYCDTTCFERNQLLGVSLFKSESLPRRPHNRGGLPAKKPRCNVIADDAERAAESSGDDKKRISSESCTYYNLPTELRMPTETSKQNRTKKVKKQNSNNSNSSSNNSSNCNNNNNSAVDGHHHNSIYEDLDDGATDAIGTKSPKSSTLPKNKPNKGPKIDSNHEPADGKSLPKLISFFANNHQHQTPPSPPNPPPGKAARLAKPQISPKPNRQPNTNIDGQQTRPKPSLPLKPKPTQSKAAVTKQEENKVMYQPYNITKAKAEELLRTGVRGTYTFVASNDTGGSLTSTLSIFDGSKVRHFNVESDSDGKLSIGNCSFNSLSEIVDYFKCHPVARDANGNQLKLTKYLRIQ